MSKHNTHLTDFTSLVLAFFCYVKQHPHSVCCLCQSPFWAHSLYICQGCALYASSQQNTKVPGDLAQNDLPTDVTHVIVSARIRVSGDLASSPKAQKLLLGERSNAQKDVESFPQFVCAVIVEPYVKISQPLIQQLQMLNVVLQEKQKGTRQCLLPHCLPSDFHRKHLRWKDNCRMPWSQSFTHPL